MLSKLKKLHFQYWWVGLFVALAISILGANYGRKVPIRLSLADLLPENRQSVLDLKEVTKDVGGVGYFIVLIGPVNEKPEQYLTSVNDAVKKLPDIRYSFYEKESYLLRNAALFLLPPQKFDELLKNAKVIFTEGKKDAFDLGLDDEEESAQNKLENAKAFFKDLASSPAAKETERYFLSQDGKYAMLLAKPSFDSEDLEKSKELVANATLAIGKALPGGVPFKLVGRYVDKVNDVAQIERDITKTSVFSLVAIFSVLIVGLGTVRGSLATVAAVTLALGWTTGFSYFAVGQINILTGFLLAILGGLGVEYGIHFIRRYYQERDSGLDHEPALHATFHHMSRALLSAALTSAGAFFILVFSDFRGFSELGKIAGFGVLAIYLVYVLCFPAMGKVLRRKRRAKNLARLFGYFPFDSKWKVALVPLAVVVGLGLMNARFEYDFERMHDLSKETMRLNHLVNELFGRSLTPAALLTQNKVQTSEVTRWLKDPKHSSMVQEVISLHSLISDDMQSRYERLERFRASIRKASDSELSSKVGLDPKLVRGWVESKPQAKEDLPPQLREAFGASGNIVLVYPKENLDQADALRRFSNLLEESKRSFSGTRIGSDAKLFIEIFDHIVDDGRIVLVLFLIGAMGVLWLDFRNIRDAVSLVVQLVLGIVMLVALMGAVGVSFSILNVAMIPAVLAAGIDMGVHVRHREKEGFSILSSARFVSQAVHLSVLTTILGFGSLFIAQAGILKGIAWVSVLGQLSMYIVCMFAWPVLKQEFARFAEEKDSSFKESHPSREATLGSG
ncbi:MAG: MMPL family transporter [Bdellovibrionota bacterium]